MYPIHDENLLSKDSFFYWMKDQILKWVMVIVDEIRKIIVLGAKEVKDQIIDIGTDGMGFSFKNIVKNFTNHKAGIALCVNSVVQEKEPIKIASEIGKIGSMLGLETNLTESIMAGAAGLMKVQPMENIPQEMIEARGLMDTVPALGMLCTLAGKEVLDVDLGHFITQSANNTKNIGILVTHLMKAGESLNLIKPSNYEMLASLNEKVLALKDELTWLNRTVALEGIQLCTPAGSERLRIFEQNLKEIQTILHTTSNTTLKNSHIFTTCQQINVEAQKLMTIAAQLQQQKVRVKPVGVCFYGETNLGKSQLYPALIEKIKEKWRHKELTKLGNLSNWQTWYVQWRDDFDTGYAGQELVYMDDAFQVKDDRDHLMHYAFISNQPIGMVMAKESEKGKPFNGRLVVATANCLPVKSTSVNDVSALHTRFPLTIRVTRKSRAPSEYDPNFEHLKFQLGHMRDMVNPKRAESTKECSLDEVAEQVITQLEINHDFWHDVMMAHHPSIELQGDSEEELIEFQPGDFEEDETMSISTGLETIAEEEESDLDEFESAEEPFSDAQSTTSSIYEDAIQPVTYRSHRAVTVAGGDIETKLEGLQKALLVGLVSAMDNPHCVDAVGLGEWTKHIYRKHDRKTGFQVICEENLSGYEFIVSLGAYHIPQTPEFQEMTAKIGFIKVESMGSEYIWSPYFFHGSTLLLVHPLMRDLLIRELMPKWRKTVIKSWKKLREFWSNPHTRRRMQRFLIGSIAVSFIPEITATNLSTFIMGHAFMNNWTAIAPHYLPIPRLFHYTNFYNVGLDKCFEYLTESLKWLQDVINRSLLRLLEILGVDIGPYLTATCKVIAEISTQTLILGIVSLLAYAVYRLIMAFINRDKNDEVIEEQSPRDKIRPEKKFTLKPKVLEMRSWKDDENCSVDEIEEYYVLHNGRNLETVQNGNVIDVLLDIHKRSSGVTVSGHLVKPHLGCYRVNIENVTEQIEEGKTLVRKYYYEKQQKILQLNIDLQEKEEQIKERFLNIITGYERLNPGDYECYFLISKGEHIFLQLNFLYRNRMQGGVSLNYTKDIARSMNREKEAINGTKAKTDKTVEQIVLNGEKAGLEVHQTVKRKHSVVISMVEPKDMDSTRTGNRSLGLGSGNQIYFNDHMAQLGEFVRFWPAHSYSNCTSDYQVAKIHRQDSIRDLAVATILSRTEALAYFGKQSNLLRMSEVKKVFPDLSVHLFDLETFSKVSSDCGVLIHLPKSGVDTTGQARREGPKSYLLTDNTSKVADYIVIDRITQNAQLSQAGDCGGIITNISDRYQNKILGFFAAGNDKRWYGTYLTREDIIDSIEHRIEPEGDPWENLVLPGEPRDLPEGEERNFIGRLINPSPPVFKTTLTHWKKTPWSHQFEEQMEPSPLEASDPRITADILKNQAGQPSLLMEQNSKMCKKLPSMDFDLLKIVENQLIREYSAKMKDIRTTSNDIDQLLDTALNGDRNNKFVTHISTNKAAGLPWSLTEFKKKNDFLDVHPITGHISFNDSIGKHLRERIVFKLSNAKSGTRVISFSNSKVKDALVKKKHVAVGKVRVYHCIAVDKIICDSALFGSFKEVFMSRFTDLHHAVGTDPHTMDWDIIAKKLLEHPNYFDVDFENYDKYLHTELMETAFNIMRGVIQINAPDEWDLARAVLADESIRTYVVDYDTVYMTHRGNKSGEFLTTIVNCIANDILSFYSFIKTTGISDIQTFRENVNIVSFGDDKIESVSDLFAEKYNYMTVKRVLEEVGHKITPGSKDGEEKPFTQFENLQFLKRSFKILDDHWVAPLLPRSIESPLVWTQISESEYSIWIELIKQLLDEALLHSKEYFDEMCKKLHGGENGDLVGKISHIISRDYHAAKQAYFQRYLKL